MCQFKEKSFSTKNNKLHLTSRKQMCRFLDNQPYYRDKLDVKHKWYQERI